MRTGHLAPLASFVIVTLASFACSSENSTTSSSGSSGSTDQDSGTSTPTEEAGTTDGATGDTVAPPSACPAYKPKTIIVVGDSISDVGAGDPVEKPYYRTLLVTNDDAKYPAWKGFDLATCAGLDPAAGVVKASKGGAIATVPASNEPSNKGILLNQVTDLPTSLPGPVLVVGTIGGNDVQRGLANVILGSPQQQQADIDKFVAGFGAAMAELSKPDRFGAGVKVDILMTNIYDPSGGTGKFYYEPAKGKCPGALGLWPEDRTTAEPLAKWNDAMKAEAAKYPKVKMLELYAPFTKHSVSTPEADNWFYKDCIHPSALGHHAIRGIFFSGMATLP